MLRELLQHAIRGLQPLLVLLRLVAFLRGGGGSALRRCRRACSRRGAAWRAWGAIRGRSPRGDAPPRCETAPPPCWAAPAWSRASSRQPWRPLLPRAAQTAAKPRQNDAAARGALAARRPACSPALGAERARSWRPAGGFSTRSLRAFPPPWFRKFVSDLIGISFLDGLRLRGGGGGDGRGTRRSVTIAVWPSSLIRRTSSAQATPRFAAFASAAPVASPSYPFFVRPGCAADHVSAPALVGRWSCSRVNALCAETERHRPA